MKRTLALVTLAALLVLLLPLGAVLGQAPPGATTRINAKSAGVTPPAQFELIQLVIDFAPGAWTPVHKHGGQGFVTVIAGEVTRRSEGVQTIYKTGETWVESADHFHDAGNNTNEPARVLASFLLPAGATLTTVQPGVLAPTPTSVTTYRSQTPITSPAATVDIFQLVLDFAVGSATPPHSHGGPGLVTVLAGQMSVKEAGAEAKYSPGQQWLEGPGSVAVVGNAGTTPASIAVTFVVAPGVPLTTVASAPAPPSTGTGITGGPRDHGVPVVALTIVAVGLAVVSGYLLRGRRRAA